MTVKPRSLPPDRDPPSRGGDGPPNPPKRPRILVVDDSAICLEAVSVMLEEEDFEVFTVDSPFGLSSVLHEKDPNLVLVDVAMPGLQGDKLVEITVRNLRADRACPIVLHSDRPVAELERLAAECKAAGFIQKTSIASDFVRQVRRFLASAGGPPSARPR